MKLITKEQIIDAAFIIFKRNTFDFTMDDLAKELNISKRTLYKKIKNKELVIKLMIDNEKQSIKEQQNKIMSNHNLSISEKLFKLLTVLPVHHEIMYLSTINSLEESYPDLYKYMEEYFKSDWNYAFKLMDEGMEKKKFRIFNKYLFKEMYVRGVTTGYDHNFREQHSLTYKDIVNNVASILLQGIKEDNNG